MKTSHLHDLWASPDNSRLTPKQFSFRLPVHVAAKLAALCELYPHKNRTQIVADLLAAALDDLEKNLPQELGDPIGYEEEEIEQMVARHEGYEYERLYYLGGPRGRYRFAVNRHYAELEREMGTEKPGVVYPDEYVKESDFRR